VLNIRKPAHPLTSPKKYNWTNLSSRELRIISQNTEIRNPTIIQKKISDQLLDVLGFYQYKGEQDFFIKIISSQDYKIQSIADEITAYLFDAGISVNLVKNGYPRKIIELNRWIYLYPLLYYNFNAKSLNELFLIGKEVGRMHRVMTDCPIKNDICNNGKNKNKLLRRQFKYIKLNKISPWFSQEAIELIKNFSYENYDVLEKYQQMVHGDLNFGNIIITKAQHPVIIDFEDSLVSWLNPIYDIAFVIQRFIFLNSSNVDKIQLASFFINGYKSKYKIAHDKGDLYSILKMISIRSLLILSTLDGEQATVYKSEIDKFIRLYKNTSENKLLIFKIEELF
jgi:thiamine kinase-like enzyme